MELFYSTRYFSQTYQILRSPNTWVSQETFCIPPESCSVRFLLILLFCYLKTISANFKNLPQSWTSRYDTQRCFFIVCEINASFGHKCRLYTCRCKSSTWFFKILFLNWLGDRTRPFETSRWKLNCSSVSMNKELKDTNCFRSSFLLIFWGKKFRREIVSLEGNEIWICIWRKGKHHLCQASS